MLRRPAAIAQSIDSRRWQCDCGRSPILTNGVLLRDGRRRDRLGAIAHRGIAGSQPNWAPSGGSAALRGPSHGPHRPGKVPPNPTSHRFPFDSAEYIDTLYHPRDTAPGCHEKSIAVAPPSRNQESGGLLAVGRPGRFGSGANHRMLRIGTWAVGRLAMV